MTFVFGPFRLEEEERRLLKHGEPVHVPPKAFDVLRVLLANANGAVTKAQLLEQVWPDTFVEEGVLAVHVSALRKLLGEEAGVAIETAPRVGYRLSGEVTTADLAATPAAAPPAVETAASVAAVPTVASRMRSRSALAALAIVPFAIAAVVIWPAGSRESPAVSSIAVLPFTSVATATDQAHLTIGMTDAIITRLGGLGPLRVPPTATVRHFIDSPRDPRDIGRELGVDAVLTGTIAREDDRLRLTLQLTRVNDGHLMWNGRFDERFTGIFSVQDTITERVAASLIPGPSGGGVRRRPPVTSNLEAYEIYLRARESWARRTPASIRRAIEMYQQAIARDAGFAAAYAGLADAYSLTASGLRPAERFPRAKAAAERALVLDESLVEAHNALAFISYKWEWQWDRSERAFRRALELEPSYVLAHHWYGEFLSIIGRHAEAIAQLETARQLDPYSTAIRVDVAAAYVRAGRFDEGIALLQEALMRDPSSAGTVNGLHNAFRAAGRDDQAFDAFLRLRALGGASEADLNRLRARYRIGGIRVVAETELQRLLAADARGAGNLTSIAASIARNYALLGDRDQAMHWLEEGTRRRDDAPLTIRSVWYWTPYRSDPRFQAVERTVAMPGSRQ